MDAWVTILTALLAAIVGGWVGASGQFQTQRRLRSLDLIWDFRLYLNKTQQAMWDENNNWLQFEERIHWIRVAASDPRVNLDSEKVEAFIKVATATRRNIHSGLSTDESEGLQLLDEVDLASAALDKLAIERLRKLA
jgi:hypothetical protein